MSSYAESGSPFLWAEYTIANAPVIPHPFPHIYVRGVFPQGFYDELQRHLPPPQAMQSLEEARGTGGYPERSVLELPLEGSPRLAEPLRSFWTGVAQGFLGGDGRFGRAVLAKFEPAIAPRLQNSRDYEIVDELVLIRDERRYQLGPHTDKPTKLVSLLFYLPGNDRFARHGTSIYVPRDPAFTCPGGPHHPFEQFERMATMPFLPNTLFGFPKTANSFHGVEPVREEGVERWLLLYDLYARDAQPREKAPPQAATAAPQVRFTF